jgi:DNA-binding transcriptional MerR regulator
MPRKPSPLGYTPAQLARAAGVSTDTLRHYESRSLIPTPPRAANGYRTYPADTLARVQLIRRALAIGFTIDELARVLRSRDRGEVPCAGVRDLAARKIGEVIDYDVTSRRAKQVTIRLRLTSGATGVAPGSERVELGSEEETDYATTE